MIKTGFQFKRDMNDLDADLAALRRNVALQNALAKYEWQTLVANGSELVSRRPRKLRVSVFYRIGKDSKWSGYYSKAGRRARRERTWGPVYVRPQHAQYAAVYVQERYN